jgi:hypothetical protein
MKHFFSQLSLVLGLLASIQTAHAEYLFSAEASARTQPQASNLVGTLAYDGMLWGQKSAENPLYGYYRIGSRFGGSPSLSGFIQIAPLAPLIFEIQRGFTKRFTRPVNFDCNNFECFGKVDRTDYSIRLAAAYKSWVLLNTVMWRQIETESASQQIYLELENLTMTPGSQQFFETTSILCYRLSEEQMLGLLYNSGVLTERNQRFEAAYGIYRQKWNDFHFTAGAGQYRSYFSNLNGFSLVFAINRTWGEGLSLF